MNPTLSAGAPELSRVALSRRDQSRLFLFRISLGVIQGSHSWQLFPIQCRATETSTAWASQSATTLRWAAKTWLDFVELVRINGDPGNAEVFMQYPHH